jgi:hypothetical protein
LQITASSDCWDSEQEYVRYGLDLAQWQRNFELLLNQPWISFCDIIQQYFITPFQRLLAHFTTTTFEIPIEMKGVLSKKHIENDILPIFIGKTGERIKDGELTFFKLFTLDNIVEQTKDFPTHDPPTTQQREQLHILRTTIIYKLRIFIEYLSSVVTFKNKMRFKSMPSSSRFLFYIQGIVLYGSLESLFITNRNFNKCMINIFDYQMKKYNREILVTDPKEIKKRIETVNEKERTHVIAEFNKLTKEERKVELQNKRLGLGKWSVGGTKLIYKYDKNYYDLEREKRLEAGIIDYQFDARVPDSNSRHEVQDYERNEGYDNRQHAEDD